MGSCGPFRRTRCARTLTGREEFWPGTRPGQKRIGVLSPLRRRNSAGPAAHVAAKNGLHWVRACGRELCEAGPRYTPWPKTDWSSFPAAAAKFRGPRGACGGETWTAILRAPRQAARTSGFARALRSNRNPGGGPPALCRGVCLEGGGAGMGDERCRHQIGGRLTPGFLPALLAGR